MVCHVHVANELAAREHLHSGVHHRAAVCVPVGISAYIAETDLDQLFVLIQGIDGFHPFSRIAVGQI